MLDESEKIEITDQRLMHLEDAFKASISEPEEGDDVEGTEGIMGAVEALEIHRKQPQISSLVHGKDGFASTRECERAEGSGAESWESLKEKSSEEDDLLGQEVATPPYRGTGADEGGNGLL